MSGQAKLMLSAKPCSPAPSSSFCMPAISAWRVRRRIKITTPGWRPSGRGARKSFRLQVTRIASGACAHVSASASVAVTGSTSQSRYRITAMTEPLGQIVEHVLIEEEGHARGSYICLATRSSISAR